RGRDRGEPVRPAHAPGRRIGRLPHHRLDVGGWAHDVAQGRGAGRAAPDPDGRAPRSPDPRARGGGQPHRLHPGIVRRSHPRSPLVRALPRATGDRGRLHSRAGGPRPRARAARGHPGEVRHEGRLTMRAALGLVVALALLSVVTPPVHAKDCRGETPLPADHAVVPADPGVPAEVAAFVGEWSGTWTARGQEWECTVLVVQEVYANGYARGVYSVGMAE